MVVQEVQARGSQKPSRGNLLAGGNAGIGECAPGGISTVRYLGPRRATLRLQKGRLGTRPETTLQACIRIAQTSEARLGVFFPYSNAQASRRRLPDSH